MHNANWVRARSVSSGTGPLTLSAYADGHGAWPLPGSQLAPGQDAPYTIEWDDTGAPIEMGVGCVNAAGQWVRRRVSDTLVAGVYTQATAAAGLSPVDLPAGQTWRLIITPQAASLGRPPRPMWASGVQNNDWFTQDNFAALSTGSITIGWQNRLIAWDADVCLRGPVDALAFMAGSTAGLMDLAIYECLHTGEPGALLIGWSAWSAQAGALNVLQFAAASGPWSGGPRRLPPGRYKFAVNCAAAAVFSGLATLMDSCVGWAGGTISAAATSCLVTAVGATTGTLLDPWPGSASAQPFNGVAGNRNIPIFFMRRAS